jgi:cation diffusion facilitator CzcD-associated flavoprotein CzcO
VPRVSQLHLFQRTPPWILPRRDLAFTAKERWRFRNLPFYRLWFRVRLFLAHEGRVAGFTHGAATLRTVERYARDLLDRQVGDPILRAKLTPAYAIGCKRLLISSDWYPALQASNVEVVTAGIREIRSHSIVCENGVERTIDAIIFATGFDTQNNLSRLAVSGRGGQWLTRRWQDRPDAYLGTLISGFPNLYTMLGPNSGLAHNSQIYMIESQARYILSCLKLCRQRAARSLDVRENVQVGFNEDLQQRLAKTIWQTGGCSNWYQDTAGRNTINWPGTSREFRRRTSHARAADFWLRPTLDQ